MSNQALLAHCSCSADLTLSVFTAYYGEQYSIEKQPAFNDYLFDERIAMASACFGQHMRKSWAHMLS